MLLQSGVASDCGLIRPSNEDSFLLRPGLYAVCDGMGGARAGEVASQMACLGLLALDPASAGQQELRRAITETNHAIVRRSLTEDRLLGMGTTLTVVLVREKSLLLAHVGDSRAYLLHDGDLTQLTDDHSWVGEMVRRGELTPAQAAVHPHRSVITRALGTDGDIDPDITEIAVAEGDRILVCSDGLTSMVDSPGISELLQREEDPQTVAESLVKAALAEGGEDNVTVVVVDLVAESDQDGGEGKARGRSDDRILIGPSHRGTMVAASSHRGRRTGAAVRERLSRHTTPPLRPVGPETAEDSPTTAESTAGDLEAASEPAADDLPAAGLPPAAGDSPAAKAAAPTEGSPAAAALPAEAPKRRRVRRRWIWLAVIVAVIVLAVAGFAWYNSTVYYLGIGDDGTVTLFQGLPGSVLGIELSRVFQGSTVDYESLASYSHLQDRVDNRDRVSEEEGRAFLETVRALQ